MAGATAMNSFDTALYVAAYNSADPAAATDLTASPWTELAEVISVNGVPLEPSVTKVTHLRSPGKAQEKVPGFIDAGQNTFKMNYSKTLLTDLLDWVPGGINAGDVSPAWGRCKFTLLLPDHGAWVFIGFIKGNPIDVPEDDRLTLDVTIEISGLPTFYEFA